MSIVSASTLFSKSAKPKGSANVTGKVMHVNGELYVLLTGAEEPTPATTTVSVKDGDLVLCTFESRNLLIIGNQTDIAGGAIDGITSETDEDGSRSIGIQASNGAIKALASEGAFSILKDSDLIAVFTIGSTNFYVPAYFTHDVQIVGDLTLLGSLIMDSEISIDRGLSVRGGLNVSGGAEIQDGLNVVGPLVVDEAIEIAKTEDGNVSIKPIGRDDLSITFSDTDINITGDLRLNGLRVLTEDDLNPDVPEIPEEGGE